MRQKRRLVVVLFSALLVTQSAARGEDVVLVSSSSNPLYTKVIEGFSAELREPFSTLELSSSGQGESQVTDPAVLNKNPRVLVVVGVAALKWAQQKARKLPIVFSAISQPQQEEMKSPTATGVAIYPAVADTLRAIRDLNPAISRLGLIYSKSWTEGFIADAKEQASKLGIQLITRAVESPQDVLPALNDIFERSNGFWMLQEPLLLKPEMINYLLFLQMTKRVGLMTFSPQLVKKGALAAFHVEYADQGKQAAVLVKSILGGKNPSQLPIQSSPGKLTINPNTAAKLGLKPSDELLRRAGVKQSKE
jgi:putative tryptophan/tyrosine transport system substrate-binding protein